MEWPGACPGRAGPGTLLTPGFPTRTPNRPMDYPHFAVIAGPDKGRNLPVHPGRGHPLGRHADAPYRVNDQRVSRYHCLVSSADGEVTVTDQGGSGGTLVNGAKATARPLRHG